jgi:hypothetical protein
MFNMSIHNALVDLLGKPVVEDDQTAIKVTDGTINVVSKGKWKVLDPC